MRHLASIASVLLLAVGCGNPSDAVGWARRAASRSRTQEKLEALEQVRKAPGDRKAAVPHLLEVLKQSPRARAEAALVLGEIGDPSAVPGMVAAIEPAGHRPRRLRGQPPAGDALGAMKAREAVPAPPAAHDLP